MAPKEKEKNKKCLFETIPIQRALHLKHEVKEKSLKTFSSVFLGGVVKEVIEDLKRKKKWWIILWHDCKNSNLLSKNEFILILSQ